MPKLKYAPIYDYNLDCTYTATSRKHSGLSDPIRYGLTRKQVEELIELGQWQLFINQWNVKRLSYLAKHGMLCVICNRVGNQHITILGKRICKRCQNKKDEIMNGETNG